MTTSTEAQGLVSRSLSLRFQAERKYAQGNTINLRCDSSLPGIPYPPQSITEIVPYKSQQSSPQVINNQKLHWQSVAASTSSATTKWMSHFYHFVFLFLPCGKLYSNSLIIH